VNTNTTMFHGSNVEDVHKLFSILTGMGVEGLMVSPGYAYEDVSDRELFLQRQESIKVFRQILDSSKGFPFYNTRVRMRCVDDANIHRARLAQAVLYSCR